MNDVPAPAPSSAGSPAGPEVRVEAGRLRGRWEDGLAVFRGVPFASPPVGALRLAAPRPPEPWDGVREAAGFGPPPPQSGALSPAPAPPVEGDDWLTVNVWSPDPGAAGLPVMVWIHGGAYLAGTASDPGYDGAPIARASGAVVVTFNYRVAVEGFAHLSGAPANRGLLDQIAALEWVRDGIAAFGGDPGRVTVFGESAGAGSIAALMAMPRAAGLFRRAIAQSVPGTFFSADLAGDIAAAIAAGLGLRPTAADFASAAPGRLNAAADAVAGAMARHEARWGRVAHTPSPFSPVVDGDVLPRAPWRAMADGAAADVALITGHNRDEYRLFIALAGMLGRITAEQADTAVRTFAPDPGAFRHAFPEATPERLYELVYSDWLFRMPSLRLAEAHAAGGGAAHLYELTWEAPGMGGVLGSCHGLDVPLVLGNTAGGLSALLFGDRRLPAGPSTAMGAAWTSFAATGDPGWPAYDPRQRLTRVFDEETRTVPYPEDTSRRLWAGHDFDALPLSRPRS